MSLDAGVRDALSLSGHEVGRYDNLAGIDDDAEGPLLFEIPVPAAWAMLLEAERADLRDGRTAPRDHVVARRLLDPLADLAPRSAEPRAHSDASPSALLARSDRLLDAPGYADWCYDAGEHVLDEFRLGLLARARPSAPPDEATVTRAAEALRRAGEPRRLARLLAHNAVAHLAAGESEAAAAALAVTGALASGRFADVPLVRRLVRESLHPGHYFLAPPSEVPSRTTVMGMMLGRRRPTKARIFAVDLAWILLRAFEVWASRLPPRERPHDDRVQDAAFALAQAGTRVATRWLAGREADRVADAAERETLRPSWRTTTAPCCTISAGRRRPTTPTSRGSWRASATPRCRSSSTSASRVARRAAPISRGGSRPRRKAAGPSRPGRRPRPSCGVGRGASRPTRRRTRPPPSRPCSATASARLAGPPPRRTTRRPRPSFAPFAGSTVPRPHAPARRSSRSSGASPSRSAGAATGSIVATLSSGSRS